MKIIYEPKGIAKEYSELAINLYIGCEYRCKYCYAPKQDWEKFTKEVIAKLEKLGKKYYIKDSLKKYI